MQSSNAKIPDRDKIWDKIWDRICKDEYQNIYREIDQKYVFNTWIFNSVLKSSFQNMKTSNNKFSQSK